ncbi:MAG: tRNA (N6-threonylcarbamoyladenosine(37)-N6)-methyltransferase TrmO [Elusimicrobia bacterium]|nr:tRNA (N6-threonylcarbamoyladenosine(37)-N6)-methyltransferase TrmO [Elusimicrobiota bacterium]
MGITVRPIGRIQGGTVRLHKRWTKALDGIEGFSHLIVLFWLHEAHRPSLKIHPKGVKQIPKIGYLATRTPHRANPIGVTVVRLFKRRGSILFVEGLDAWDGTPVLDVKPYTKKDSIRRLRMPGWVSLLDKAETDPLRKYVSGNDSGLARRATTEI